MLEVIYSRKEAVEDGVLFPVSKGIMEKAGFKGTVYFAQGLHALVEEEAHKYVMNKASIYYHRYSITLNILIAANQAVIAAAKQKEETNITSFNIAIDETEHKCLITVEKNDEEGVVWTVMLPSDY